METKMVCSSCTDAWPAARLIIVVLLLFCSGCESRPYEVAPVSGTIFLDNEPLSGAIINTQPVAASSSSSPGPGSFGRTDEDGRYTLELVNPAETGAVVGRHRVVIRIAEELSASDEIAQGRSPSMRLPVKALDGSLYLKVPSEGLETADFQFESRKKRSRRRSR